MMTSLAGALMMVMGAIPRILGFLLILIIGWFIASLIDKGVTALLHAVKFNQLADRSGFSGFVRKMGVQQDASSFLGALVKWFIRLLVLVVAFDALGLPAVSDVLRALLLWLPNLVVALVVLVIGGLLARAGSDLVRGATAQAGFQKPELMARIASTAIMAFAIIIAVNQLGIAATLVNTLFMAVVGAAALAFGLAFGLGGRDVAAQIWQRAYENSDQAAAKLGAATDAAARTAQTPSSQPQPQPQPGRPRI